LNKAAPDPAGDGTPGLAYSSEGGEAYSPAECIGAVKRPGRMQSRSQARQHVVCGTVEFERADAHSPLHSAHKCVLKEGREPRAFGGAVRDVLQLRPYPQNIADPA